MENNLIQSYGRKQGRTLKKWQKTLKDECLSNFSITPQENINPQELFADNMNEYWLEIGFGSGEHIAHKAMLNQSVGMIASEVYINGVLSLVGKIEKNAIQNIRIFQEDARLLLQSLPKKSVAKVFVLFPDPWPKRRQYKKRLLQNDFLDLIAKILPKNGELLIATDHADYLEHIIKVMISRRDFIWTAKSKADWLDEPKDWTQTRYQQKAIAEGRHSTFLHFKRTEK